MDPAKPDEKKTAESKDLLKKVEDKEEKTLLKEVPDESKSKQESTEEQRLNQVRDFQNLFEGIKLDAEEREMMRELTEKAKAGEAENEETKKLMKTLATKVQERTEKENKDFSSKKRAENISALMDTHGFWDNQPVPHTTDTVKDEDYDAPIDKEKTVDEIQAEPYALPDGF